jgi:hypothetical protein
MLLAPVETTLPLRSVASVLPLLRWRRASKLSPKSRLKRRPTPGSPRMLEQLKLPILHAGLINGPRDPSRPGCLR